jgi:hypothetical protein
MKKSKARKPHGGDSQNNWWSSSNHPIYVRIMLVATLLSVLITVLSYLGPFNLFPKVEPPVTAQEQSYVDLTRKAMEDGIALLNLSSAPPHLRAKFKDPAYANLSRRISDELQEVRQSEPSERLRAYHANVSLFLEKSQESAALMSRYSYTFDQDTFNRAEDAAMEARRAMNQGAAELNRITEKLKKEF